MLPGEIAEALLRPVASADLTTDRSGTRIWQVILDDRRVLAVKYTEPDPTNLRPQAGGLAAQEATVLRAMPDDTGYLYADGKAATGTWIAVNWINKPNLNQVWQRAHQTGRSARADRLSCRSPWPPPPPYSDCTAAAGATATSMPGHILYTHGRARLIDYTWAQSPAVIDTQMPYRGGWAHATPPEIAAQLLHTDPSHNVTIDPAAEVYSLAAVLCGLWSGQLIHDFGPAADPEHRSLPGIYHTICDEATLRSIDIGGWPAMQHLAAEMLAHDPADRPSIDEVRERLMWLSERTRN